MARFSPGLCPRVAGVMFAVLAFFAVLALAGVAAEEEAQDALPFEKHVVHFGWDRVHTAYMRERWREMDASPTLDGTGFFVVAKDEAGNEVSSRNVMDGTTEWKPEWFEPCVEDLKACEFRNLKHNFAQITCVPGDLRWDDDAGWERVCGKARIIADVVRRGGQRGICMDPESYHHPMFMFQPELGLSYAETCRLVRLRGAGFMRAICEVYPDITFFSFFFASQTAGAGNRPDPVAALEPLHYGLLPMFLDGMLSAATPGVVFVDGCENGYYLQGDEYHAAARKMRQWNGACVRQISPENRAKYRAQVQAGFGFYLDMYTNVEGSKYYRGPAPGKTRLETLFANLGCALDASDQYVWLWGESGRWYTGLNEDTYTSERVRKTGAGGRLWEECLPGLSDGILRLKNPHLAARTTLERRREAGTLENLAQNADFDDLEPGPGRRFGAFVTWQSEDSAAAGGTWEIVDLDTDGDRALLFRKVEWGCVLQKAPCQPGDRFFVRARCKVAGAGRPSIHVGWQTADQKWHRWGDDLNFAFGPPDAEGWAVAEGLVVVPPDTFWLAYQLGVKGQKTDEDRCWFDDLEFFDISK